MTSNDPFNNEFGNSLRDSILNKKLKDLQIRVSHLEIDEALIHELERLVNELIEVVNQKERTYIVENDDYIIENHLDENPLDITPYTLVFTTTPTITKESDGE